MKTVRKTWEYVAGLLLLAGSLAVYLNVILGPPLPWSRLVRSIPGGFWVMVVAAFVTIVIAEAAIAGRSDVGSRKFVLFRVMVVSLLVNVMCAAILMVLLCLRECSGFSPVQLKGPVPSLWIGGLAFAGSAATFVTALALLTLRPRMILRITFLLLLILALAGAFVAYRKPYTTWSRWTMPTQLRVRLLVRALSDPDKEVRIRSAGALGGIGPAAKDAVPALIKALDDKSWVVRQVTVRVLGAIGPGAKEAIPAILRALGEEDNHGMSLTVAEALAGICWGSKTSILAWGAAGDDREERIKALIKPLGNPDAEFRAAAAEILGYIGPAAKPAIPDLERLAENDEAPDVRRQAREALEKIRK